MRVRKYGLAAAGVVGATVLLTATPAFAQDAVPEPIAAVDVNLLWVVIGAVLVIFMQAGFALVETGFCRAKHAAHVVSTNFAIFGLGFVGLLPRRLPASCSAAISCAAHRTTTSRSASALIGSRQLGVPVEGRLRADRHRARTPPVCMAFFLYMVAFMDTTATIPTGAMAERWKWNSVRRLGPVLRRASTTRCSARGPGAAAGWPSSATRMNLGFGYVDFAGSGVVHAMGGVAALAGAHRARSPHRQVRQGRQAARAARPPHPDGHARHVHPAVRLVRLQRRLDVRGDRRPVRRRRRRTPRSPAPSAPSSRCSGS